MPLANLVCSSSQVLEAPARAAAATPATRFASLVARRTSRRCADALSCSYLFPGKHARRVSLQSSALRHSGNRSRFIPITQPPQAAARRVSLTPSPSRSRRAPPQTPLITMKGHGDGGLAGIAANVKKSNMLAPWLAFGMLSLVVYGAFSDGLLASAGHKPPRLFFQTCFTGAGAGAGAEPCACACFCSVLKLDGSSSRCGPSTQGGASATVRPPA